MENDVTALSDSITIKVESLDLSEDMSRLSSKNDEIMIILYEVSDSEHLNAPIFFRSTVLDAKNRLKYIRGGLNETVDSLDIMFFLLEIDTDKPIEQLDPVLRIYHNQIAKAYRELDYPTIRKFLGDEDFLGFKILTDVTYDTPVSFSCKGVHRLDEFNYSIEIKLHH